MFYIIQILRFFAAILVLLFHLHIFPSGYKGVDLFFVISGFVMYLTLFSKPKSSIFLFFRNRFIKIFFLYWITLLAFFFINPYPIDLSFIRTLLLIPGHNSIVRVSWSLSYELYFYLLIGIIAYTLSKKKATTLLFLLFLLSSILILLNLSIYSIKGSIINFLFGANIWEFLLGFIAGFLVFCQHQASKQKQKLIAAFCFTLALFLLEIPYQKSYSSLVYGTFSFVIIYLFSVYEKQDLISKKWSSYFGILGDSSYAIYLLGPVITSIIKPYNLSGSIICIFLTILLSILFNQLIETKLLLWIKQRD